ncbi:MAG: hypothetical protein JWN99_1033 [Ilumatobacteraceae bacterium]|nr:hypothetical protein [Ilumatobacteraceae bacterium]
MLNEVLVEGARIGSTIRGPMRHSIRATVMSGLVGSLLIGVSFGGQASAGIVPTVGLATAANYSMLAGSTVTNTGPSILNASVGLAPGTAVTGFPPGLVTAPGTINAATASALQAQSDLTNAYVDAAGRSIDATETADLGNLLLQAGVYAATSKGPLGLTGNLTLDGAGDPTSVFIFQTNSTLITASSSTVTLINGAQECNIFWQVGSSATLGSGSVFSGNILALDSITVTTGVTVHGRALARNGAVTLDNDTFTSPTCAQSIATGSSTTPTIPVPAAGTYGTFESGTNDTSGATGTAGTTGTQPAPAATPVAGLGTGPTLPGGAGNTSSLGDTDLSDVTLPSTGRSVGIPLLAAGLVLATGMVLLLTTRRPSLR